MFQTAQTSHRPQLAATTGDPDHAPGWAQGLRRLYGVAADPVPADLRDLLVRLEHRAANKS